MEKCWLVRNGVESDNWWDVQINVNLVHCARFLCRFPKHVNRERVLLTESNSNWIQFNLIQGKIDYDHKWLMTHFYREKVTSKNKKKKRKNTKNPGFEGQLSENLVQSVKVVDVQQSEHHDVLPDQAVFALINVDVANVAIAFERSSNAKVVELSMHFGILVHFRFRFERLRLSLHEMRSGRLCCVQRRHDWAWNKSFWGSLITNPVLEKMK